MVIRGVADDRLLDTYFAERNAHAHDLVDWAVAIGRLMEHMAEEERCARAGLPAPATPATLKSSGYGQGREQPPIRDGAVILDQVSDTGSTGYLFNQPIVRNQAGEEFRLDELLGPGFAVVLREAGTAGPSLGDRSRAVLQRIGARVVSLDGLEIVRGHLDRLFEDHEAAIVRPDGLIFGHTTSGVTLDDLIEVLAGKLALIDD
jgi:3-(3-hydroxy-phenyl)propionate hydroxylase